MDQIRVTTFDGPGTPPKMRMVDRPKVPENAALMQIGACGTDLHILKGHWPKPLPCSSVAKQWCHVTWSVRVR